VRAVGIAKLRFAAMVHREPHEHIGQLVFAVFFDVNGCTAHIIEQNPQRNTAYILENSL
jgi:hypothetical protein